MVRFAALLGFVFWLGTTAMVAAAQNLPIADAGRDGSAQVGMPVALDGSASHDPRGGFITFQWTLAQTPVASAAELADPSSPAPLLVPDAPGVYVLQLVVTGEQNVRSPPAPHRRRLP